MAGGLNTSIVNALIGLSLAFVVYFSSTYLVMSAGDFLAYFTAMGMLVKPAKTLININKPLQQAIVAGKSVFSLIDESQKAIQARIQFIQFLVRYVLTMLVFLMTMKSLH